MKCNHLPPPAKDLRFNSTYSCNKGFTLVELSIVLLVIGLLVSGVLVGKDMIRAAELRSITTQKDQLQTSVMLFQDKYQGLPGDLKNATVFWGEMGAINGGTGVCNNTAAGASGATGTQTCNGDGDGRISYNSAVGSNSESMLFVQHLNNSELLDGKYTGVWSGAFDSSNTMSGKIKNTFYHAANHGVINTTSTLLFEGSYGNVLDYVGLTTLTPAEMYGIDTKTDDGMPGLGAIVTDEGNGVNCNNVAASTTVAIAQTATYNLAYESAACRPVFKNMW